jgi:hypothetical protein
VSRRGAYWIQQFHISVQERSILDSTIPYFCPGEEHIGFNNSIFLSERETADR